MTRKTTDPIKDLVGKDQDRRLVALERTKKLSVEKAIPYLKRGLKHWDRKVRNLCALELVRRVGGKAAPILLPLRAKGLLYGSCSIGALLKREDAHLIKYLEKNRNETGKFGSEAKALLRRTKHYAKVQAAEAKLAMAQARREAKRKEREAAKAKAAKVYVPTIDHHWYDFSDYPVLEKVDSGCAAYVKMHWGQGRDMDNLYRVSEIPKRSGGLRQIEEPCPSLKVVHRGILKEIFGEARHGDACHGFREGHSIATNASPHTGKDIVLNLDLKDFFPTVSAGRVYGIYKSFVGEGEYARFLTDVSVFNKRLPQGAPTSPMIANLACTRLDRRLSGLAKKIGADYTRYADDLTFSGPEVVTRYIPAIKTIVAEEGFQVALPKLRIHRKGSRQEVTGLTVNQKVSVPRVIRRRLRAAVHAASNGKAPMWKGTEITRDALMGHISFVSSIHSELGTQLLRKFSRGPRKKK